MTKQITIELTEDMIKGIEQLLSTRPTKTFDQQVLDTLRAGIKNDVYRQERNRKVNQERKLADLTIAELREKLAELQK